MEHTPFDAPPPHAATRSLPAKRKPPVALFVLALLVLVALGAGGYVWMQKRAEEDRLTALRAQLKSLVLADNALVLEVLEMDESSHITYAEFFKRTEKNKEERDNLIRQVRAIEAGPYAKAAQNFVKLMELESEFVRAEEDLSRGSIEVSSRKESLSSAVASRDDAQQDYKVASEKYLAAPYGEDYGEKLSADMARARATSAQDQTSETFKQYSDAREKLNTKLGAAALAVSDWMHQEQSLYPYQFSPPRDVMPLLIKRKSKYSLESTGSEGSDAPITNSSSGLTTRVAAPLAPPVVAPTVEVEAAPTRLRSTSAFEGERFPETRLREITPEEIAGLDDETLRYATNEMYARYGMTFKDKDYQGNFTPWKWYQPNDRWKPSQIERAFSSTERENMKVLIAERDARRSNGEE